MDYATAFYWSKGKEVTNRDSILIQKVISSKGTILMACICNGANGCEESVIGAGYAAEVMGKWFYKQFLKRMEKGCSHSTIKRMGQRLFYTMNKELLQYSTKKHKILETGVVMLLCVHNHYHIFRLGESNVYFLKRRMISKIKKGSPQQNLGNDRKHMPDYNRGSLRGIKGILLCKESIYANILPQWIETGIGKNARCSNEESLQRTIEEIGKRVIGKNCKLNQENFVSTSIVYIKPNIFKERSVRKEIICKRDIRLSKK